MTTNSLLKITEVKLWVDGQEKKTWTERPFETKLTLPDGPHVIKVKATDRDGNNQEREARIGVNTPWNFEPTPTPSPTILLTPTLTPTKTL